jgi:hypothetical protein
MLPGVRLQDLARTVRRAVVADDDLPLEARLLAENAFEGLRDEVRMVVGEHLNADLRSAPEASTQSREQSANRRHALR